MNFCLQSPYSGREVLAAHSGALSLGVESVRSSTAMAGFVPVGTVQYCEPLFGEQPSVKNFYPEFLARWISRRLKLVTTKDGIQLDEVVFVKSASEWKARRPSSLDSCVPPGCWWLSEVVYFEQEWRYYVADGDLVTTGWYDGNDQDEPAPGLDIRWPRGFSGAIDFGRLSDGRIELVEAHAPYGCGWYGETVDNDLFALWLLVSWENRSDWLK